MKRFFRALFCRSRLDADMAAEIRAHLDAQTQRNLAAGMSVDDARAAAHRQFGGVAQIQERAREVRGLVWLENLVRDAGYAARSLVKSPGFTSVVVLTLALGIGVNSALFTWFNAAAFRPLPVRQPEQLVEFTRLNEHGNETNAMSYTDFVTYREHQTVLLELAAAAGINAELVDAVEFNAATGEKNPGLRLETVSTSYFAVFAVPMALGRPLVATDETSSGALPVIVLSHHFWQHHFGGDPSVIGRTLRLRGLAGEALTIVGVTGPGFYGTRPGALAGWVPLFMRPGEKWRTDLNATMYELTGRLRPGVPREEAAEGLQVIANEFLARAHSGAVASEIINLASASTYIQLSAQMWPALLPMICLFGAVLLVAGVNASNLILARTVTRQFEFAVRSALGASRRRLFALLMTESLMLGGLGGLAGWAVSAFMLRFVWPWLIDMVPGAREGTAGLQLHADHRVFVFTLVVSLLAGAVGGLWPALRVSRRNVVAAINREGSAFGRRVHLSRVRGVLAVAQLALSSALVFTAGLLAHRALQSQFADLGFNPARLLTLVVQAPRTFDESKIDVARRQVLERVRSLPEVAAVTAMPRFPFARWAAKVSLPGTAPEDARTFGVLQTAVPADYFDTVQLPVIRGRSFDAHESPGDRVVLISESAARAIWPDADPLGQALEVPSSLLTTSDASAAEPTIERSTRISVTVVGIVRDTRVYDPWNGFTQLVYYPLASQKQALPYLVVRTNQPVDHALAALHEAAREVTGIAPRIETAEEQLDVVFVQYRVIAWVAGILAALSLIVAVIGLYGVMSFAVNQRVKEIGIRMAVGATPRRVLSEILIHSLRLVAIGAVIGCGLSVVIAKGARALLFGVNAFDPVASGAVALFLAVIGILACWVPARRAAKVDPVVALRAE